MSSGGNAMTQPTHLDPAALQAELQWCIDEGHSGPRTHACLKSMQPLIDRLRKAEATIAPQLGSAIVRITIPDPEYADVSPGLILEDALRVATYGWPDGVSFEIIAAPDSTPTDTEVNHG
jgi:hypothetical protein